MLLLDEIFMYIIKLCLLCQCLKHRPLGQGFSGGDFI